MSPPTTTGYCDAATPRNFWMSLRAVFIVSHDRYFMDRPVDHVFAFEGDGEIKDYPGTLQRLPRMEAMAKR